MEGAAEMSYLPPAALPAHVLQRQDVHDAITAHDFGRLFFLAKKWGGISFSSIAESTGIKAQRVGTLARGEGAITSYEKICDIADGLRIPGHLLGLAQRPWEISQQVINSGMSKDDSVNRRQLIRAATGVAVVGMTTDNDHLAYRPDDETAGHLAALVQNLRQADDTAPTGSLLRASASVLALAEELTEATSPFKRQKVGRVAAEAATLHWWLTVDSGRNAKASHDRAMALAVEWGLTPLVGHLFGWRAGLALGRGDLKDAVRLAARARDPQWGMSQGGIAWASAYEARAHMLAGSDSHAYRALDIARAAYANVHPENEPSWLYWLSGEVLELDTLDMQLLQDGPGVASDLIHEVLSRLPPERARDAAWYRAHIAAAQARIGDVDAATQEAIEASKLTISTGTTWPLTELRQLAERPGLGTLREAITDTTTQRDSPVTPT
jgi:hypothetical protein